MRPMYIIGAAIALLALVGVLTWTRLAPAQVPLPPGTAVPGEPKIITQDEVEVRSGPSMNFYVTGKLHKGDKVEIVTNADKNNSGWLAIKPPSGSQSLIEARFITKQPNSATGVVKTPDAPVKPASALPNQSLANIETIKLALGTIVEIVGSEPKWDESTQTTWYTIQPPLRDVRYIQESAVAKINPVQPVSAQVSSGFVAPPGGTPLLSQADQTLDQAKQLYQLAAQSNDPNESASAKNKLQVLQQIQANQAPMGQPGYPFNTAQGSAPPKLTVGTPTSQTSTGNTALYPVSTTAPAKWTDWGTLKKTAMAKDGQTVFRLEDTHGTPLGYAVAAPGYSLDSYVGQVCCLYGTVAYRSDDLMRGHITIVSQIALQPAH
jgi:uncharacterized protein YgiM (DUF1202 family)